MTVKAVAGVLLDIDDTLVNTRGAFRVALAAVADRYLPQPHDLEAMGIHWRVDAGGWYRAHARGEMSHREQRMRRANELHAAFGGAPLGEHDYAQWDEIFEEAFRAGWAAHDDAQALLDTLDRCGIEYGAVSNADHAYQERKLERSGLGRVPMLVGIDRFGVGKPDPRVFLEGARMLGLSPGSVVYVGDEKDIDAGAAAAAGLALGIWLERPGMPPQVGEMADGTVRVESLDEVPGVLLLNC
ncbi:HAD family hydrolase [Demequina sp. TTPB684]|uniref:HAD family hydrolase n=1 Tax=unclassified Demequina TaxID=2620311 RepID=UPI001CF1164A|nr:MULTISPECIES: HAD family hydrolase [unclassified Demequina]MCB2412492.1 HAD family hydrolase [Demequina sp. TTPB684]UPU88803.1 HAD family hydrolase [Demequina sp. TMPB413]